MGDTGVSVLVAALLAVVITSLIGNLMTLSRLLYAFGRDHEIFGFLGKLNDRNIPSKAIMFVVVLSCLIPFLGRTAIGWIVDVTTLGATLIYGFLSDFVYRDAKIHKKRTEMVTGVVGVGIIVTAMLCVAHIMKTMSHFMCHGKTYWLASGWVEP